MLVLEASSRSAPPGVLWVGRIGVHYGVSQIHPTFSPVFRAFCVMGCIVGSSPLGQIFPPVWALLLPCRIQKGSRWRYTTPCLVELSGCSVESCPGVLLGIHSGFSSCPGQPPQRIHNTRGTPFRGTPFNVGVVWRGERQQCQQCNVSHAIQGFLLLTYHRYSVNNWGVYVNNKLC